jgi:hypothetical protein
MLNTLFNFNMARAISAMSAILVSSALLFGAASFIPAQAYTPTAIKAATSKPAHPVAGDAVAIWFKDPAFKKLYQQTLKNSPIGYGKGGAWVHKDIGLFPSKAFTGANAEQWVRLTTCASTLKMPCRLSHIEVFYDAEHQTLFAFLRLGGRVGWLGNERTPTSIEKSFLEPLLTADELK